MMDLHSRLQHLAGPADETTADVIQDDLARGRRAVRRNQALRVAAGSALSIAVAATALSLGPGLLDGPTGSSPTTAAAIQLVSYTGKQPDLFTIDTVPQGFFVQGQNEYELVIAPEEARTPDPAKPYLSDPGVYTGKIAVYLQNKDFTVEPAGDEQFRIGTKPAALRYIHNDEGTPDEGKTVEAIQIFVVQSPRVYLTVQFDAVTGLTKEQMIKVAGGINLTAEAVAEAEKGYAAQTTTVKPGKD
ncbi:hypothetical protein Aab01nite_84820 [Paractinoplanes abujensis]|uniref:Uncharacterized protein n=1 Tax=Paractinoplanes abujensis TaxID=882441 RepID=A0A7W7CQY2_9ACTN|nr:hypothetical protein [Actinoplanes abujensis]MBB4693106.1 hypothetical protein [Actinoplanes abujensis]GID24892.1 hypothetical protein Aab01nite_84820 [Actinoplanes abujensis]